MKFMEKQNRSVFGLKTVIAFILIDWIGLTSVWCLKETVMLPVRLLVQPCWDTRPVRMLG